MNKFKSFILYLIIVVLIILSISLYFLYLKEQKQAIKWYNEYSTLESTQKLDSALYGKQAILLNKLIEDNIQLKKEINKRDGTIVTQSSIISTLKYKIDSLTTTPFIDTTYINQDTIITKNRKFSWSNKWIMIQGYFNITSPYNIYINKLICKTLLTIDIIQQPNNTFTALVYSNNPSLIINDIKTNINYSQIKQTNKLKYLLGLGAYFDGSLKLKANFGINYSNYNILISTIFNRMPNLSVDFIIRF